MPEILTNKYTASFKKVKVNGVMQLTTKVYENRACIYTNTEKDPAKHKEYSNRFIEAMRRADTRRIFNQLETYTKAY